MGGTGKFRDSHLKIEGPAVGDLQRVFVDSLTEAAQNLPRRFVAKIRRVIDHQRRRHDGHDQVVDEGRQSASVSVLSPSAPPTSSETKAARGTANAEGDDDVEEPPHGTFVQVLESNAWREKRLIQRAMSVTMRNARHRVFITNPYFLPPKRIINTVTSAAARGVDVRVLMAGEGKSDVPPVQWAAQHIHEHLLRHGVRVYELQKQTAVVGTSNFDRWSDRRLLEVNCTMLDPDLSRQLERDFYNDLEHAKEITLYDSENRNVLLKSFHWLAYHIVTLFYRF
eukprot:TRINITY_DN55571_c0_g1_i2.p1 TRINITY_DN55571_c0_g1~~TRINITY_DN55571_c0_g1_i2.p1  ORF type:complete len:317 (-),score=153.38 TRINITY_DN55571_c0_g1_i2:8-853(-)